VSENTPAGSGADDAPPARSRTRTRSRAAEGAAAAPAEKKPGAAKPAGADDAPVAKRTTRKRTVAKAAAPEPAAEAAASEEPKAAAVKRTRTRPAPAGAKVADGDAPAKPAAKSAGAKPAAKKAAAKKPAAKPAAKKPRAGAAPADPAPEAAAAEAAGEAVGARADADADADTDDDGTAAIRRSRRGRRGGRNRNRARRPGESGDAGDERIPAARADVDGEDDDEAPTRLQARRASGRGRGRSSSRRPISGVSDEMRRVIAESPPRRMMVTVGSERMQIAVLEERTLVEHYVTRRQDVSYVGNIYVGRVQNVLPGMEAAFVDIGKGRNGVLYAGEVNYDEADLDGELPRIEEQLKAGQTVLVQVTKDPMGTKGARLTQHLSIAGRYCVLAPGEGMLGISRKLPDDERERLRVILKAIRPEGFGLIVRTAAEGATSEQLEADVSRLVRIWEQVDERAQKAKPLDTVYEEPDLVIRVIRDVFGPEFTDLVVDSEELAAQIRQYLGDVSPELVDRVQVYEPAKDPEGEDAEGAGSAGEPQSLFDAYEITNQIRRALEKKVWLKSGGYLIIEKTEAMWVIDVNTGKFVGERNLEATVLKNNLEAAGEIARQLRLRDMGGIIVIDFVDMLVPANRDEVLKRFKRELGRDRTKSRVMEISKLGLVQMTRKNVSQGLQESFTTRCEVCEGRGAKIVDRIV